MGAKIDQIGTHSARKGAPTYCLSMIGGPSAVQVFLRAGWSLGNVQDRYLFNGDGGDQLTGRTVCGLPNTDCTFSTLPPHFIDTFEMTNKEWLQTLPIYNSYPNTFKQVVPYLLASIVYHEEWLRNNLHNNHPLFSTQLFTYYVNLNYFRNNIVTGIGRCNKSKMIATGIPPHLALVNQLIGLSTNINECKEELNKQSIKLPKLVSTEILKKFSINGAVPVTQDDLNKIVNEIVTQLSDKISNNSNSDSKSNSNHTENKDSNDNITPFKFWMWGLDGKQQSFHMVWKGWKLPKCSLKDMFNLWHHGNIHDKIQPYKLLRWNDLVDKAQVQQFSKINKVFQSIESIARLNNLFPQDKSIGSLTIEETSLLFDKAFVILMEQIQPGSTTSNSYRIGDNAIGTVYNRIRKKRKLEETNVAITINHNNNNMDITIV